MFFESSKKFEKDHPLFHIVNADLSRMDDTISDFVLLLKYLLKKLKLHRDPVTNVDLIIFPENLLSLGIIYSFLLCLGCFKVYVNTGRAKVIYFHRLASISCVPLNVLYHKLFSKIGKHTKGMLK